MRLHCLEQTSARAILFDMDGTLVDSTAIIHRAWKWWTAKHSIPLEPVLAVERGRPNREVISQFGPHLDADEESRLFVAYEENDTDGLAAVEGARAAVQAAQRGPWAVVTSAKRSLADVRLRATGLPVPEVLITADLIRCGKPDPEAFLLAADRLRVDPRECLVFEDAPAGVTAAKRAGMTVIGVETAAQLLCGTIFNIRDFRQVSIASDNHGWFQIAVESGLASAS